MNINFLPPELRQNNLIRSLRNYLDKSSQTKTAAFTIFGGMLVLGLIQTSTNIPGAPDVKSEASAQTMLNQDITQVMFGAKVSESETQNILEKQVKFVASRKAFVPSLEVVKKHETEIRRVAKIKGVSENIALGVSFLENGGSEGAKSVAGAVGIYQLMPGTARDQGMVVERFRDDRLDPNKSIEAGLNYLSGNFKTLGDWGLATWSYHAGAGNVCKAVRIHAANKYGANLSGCNAEIGQFVKKHQITVHEVLSDTQVKNQLTSRLKDDSSSYPYKVMAMAHLFELNKKIGHSEFLQRVALLNTNALNVPELFKS